MISISENNIQQDDLFSDKKYVNGAYKLNEKKEKNISETR